jgi:hypothetical protein
MRRIGEVGLTDLDVHRTFVHAQAAPLGVFVSWW